MKLTGYMGIKNELGDSDLPAVGRGDTQIGGGLLPDPTTSRESSRGEAYHKRPITKVRGNQNRKPGMNPTPAKELIAGTTKMHYDVKARRREMAARNKADTSQLIVSEDFGTSPLVHGHHQFNKAHFSTAALRDLAARLHIHPVVVLLEFASGWITDTVVDPATGEVKVVKRPVVDDLRLLGAKEAAKYLSPQLKSVEIRDGTKEQRDLAEVMKLAHAHSAASSLQPGEEVVVIEGNDRTLVTTGDKMIDADLPPGEIPEDIRKLAEGEDDDESPGGSTTPAQAPDNF